jgi:hypothetical protein
MEEILGRILDAVLGAAGDRRRLQRAAGQRLREVAPSMVAFGRLLGDIGATPPGTLPAQGLTGPAINISKACQRLVTSWWTPTPPFWLRWFGSK